MPRELALFDLSFIANADFTSKQFYATELTAADTVDVCNAATDLVIGVIQNNPPSGSAATIRTAGITKWVSDGSGTAIAVGDKVGTNNAGKAVKKASANDLVFGIALSPSSADGTIIDVLIQPHQRSN